MEKEQEAVKDKKKMDIVSANPLYKYIKGVFTLIGKDGNSTLFLNGAGLHCKTNDICIKIQGFINGVSVFEELEQEKEYELCKLPGNSYRLSSIGFNEEKETTYRAIVECTNTSGGSICGINPGEFGATSKIAIYSRYCLKDSYARSIEKFGPCDVFLSKNKQYIILHKTEYDKNATFNYYKAYFTVSMEDIESEKKAHEK